MGTYLVTGAAGFIAARTCELLLAAGHTVVGVVRAEEEAEGEMAGVMGVDWDMVGIFRGGIMLDVLTGMDVLIIM